MPKPMICQLDEKFLKCGTEYSDRFVYSNYFVPLELRYEEEDGRPPILTHYQKDIFLDYYAFAPEIFRQLIPKLDLEELLEENGIEIPELGGLRRPSRDPAEYGDERRDLMDDLERSTRFEADRVRDELADARSLVRLLPREGGESRDVAELLDTHLRRLERSTERLTVATSAVGRPRSFGDEDVSSGGELGPEMTYSRSALLVRDAGEGRTGVAPPSTVMTTTEEPTEQHIDVLLNLLKSEIGYALLDRTRIRPAGFAIGEHIYTLSLAPGEEVVLEQKTFSKRLVTFEEQTDRETQLDIELASAFSTEIQEGFDRQKNASATAGVTAGGSLGANIYGVQISGNYSDSKNVTDASNKTERRSVKDSVTASQKVASRYRTAHKIDFKISTEQGFEQTSKRTIRNPNRFTSLSLEFFKKLQVLELTQERYGVRLCWAPCIKDPAFDFVERIRKGRQAIIKRAEDAVAVSPRPTPPTPPPVQQQAGKPPVWVPSAPVEADKWGLTNDMSADYDITIPGPEGYVWDGDATSVKNSLSVTWQNVANRSHHAEPALDPWVEGTDVKLKVHVGVDWKILIGEPRGRIYMTAGANFVPVGGGAGTATGGEDDPEYKKTWAAYQLQLQQWQQGVNDSLEEARKKAAEEADKWEESVRDQFNPVAELMNRVIAHHFPPALRDECWEIDLWQSIFDWDSASFVAFPGWWGAGPMRDWTREPADFMNASWAKLYVPIRIGFERAALRWIYDKVIEQKADAKKETAFDRIVKDLEEFRKKSFDDAREVSILEADDDEHVHPHTSGEACPVFEEKVICMAHWHEVMPTDGTHIEVLQGMTSAEDPITTVEVDAANKLKSALVASHEQDVELKKKAIGEMSEVNVSVTIDTDGSAGPS